MGAPVIPCCSAGQISEALHRIENSIADAAYEAEAIRDGAALGIAERWQIARAAELRTQALSLAGMLGAVPAAAVSAAASVTPDQRAA